MSDLRQTLPAPSLNVAPPTRDAVEALRLATFHLHEELDRNLPLGGQSPSLVDYAFHLSALRDWQLALAPWLSRTISSPASLALMARDLADCSRAMVVVPEPLQVDLQFFKLGDDGSNEFCWGVAYVLEGSRLGGQVLYRRLREPLSPHPLRYLGERISGIPSWPEMLSALRLNLSSPSAQASGCRGAIAAFELLLSLFKQRNVIP